MACYTVRLASVGNPDLRQDPMRPISECKTVEVSSLAEASRVCLAYIAHNELGKGNWSGGQVCDHNGRRVARVSYNGRVWPE